jgi:hypothetical protein
MILKNSDTVIGLFLGQVREEHVDLQSGLDQKRGKARWISGIRAIQGNLKAKGYQIASEADETTLGPASFVLVDRTTIRFSSTSMSEMR